MKPSSIRAALPNLIRKQRPVFLWGAPGVGKSDVIALIAKDMKLELRDVRLSLLDPVDLKGFPVINAAANQMSWLPPDFLPAMKVKNKPNTSKGLLFLDEMNTAAPAVQASGYQLVLNRRIGEYVLPDGWSVVAAGNRTSDRSVVHTMPAALANRFVHLDFDVNASDWDIWAKDNGMHLDLRAFMRFRSNLLHSFDPKENPRAFPSPRSWAFVNDIYKNNMAADDEFELIKGTVGEGAATEFLAFTRIVKDLPTVDQVLLDPKHTKVPTEPSAQYAMVTALEAKSTPNNFPRIMEYIGRFAMEFQVVYVRGAVRHNIEISGNKAYVDWGTKSEAYLA